MVAQVIRQQAVLDLIDGAVRIVSHLLEPHPDQNSTADVIAYDACPTALAALQTGDLLGLAVKLLNLPPQATHLSYGLRVVLSQVVGHDIVRALGRQHDAEQFHLVVLGKVLDLDEFALSLLLGRPVQGIHATIGASCTRVINLTVIFEWTVVDLLHALYREHQRLSGIPGVHKHATKEQPLLVNSVGQHLPHMLELCLAIASRVIDTVVDDPELIADGIDIHACDHANAFDHPMGVTAILPPHQIDAFGEVLVNHRVVKDEIALRRLDYLVAHVLPHQTRRDAVARQIAVDGVMAERL